MMIYFVVASIEGREQELLRLVRSIKSSFASFKIVIVRQYQSSEFYLADVVVHNIKKYGASMARNIGIEIVSNIIADEEYLAFPDDDSWYEQVPEHIFGLDDMDVIVGRVSSGNTPGSTQISMHASPLSMKYLPFFWVYPAINCPSFFIKWRALGAIRFNECYGPGAYISAAEETELLFRIARERKISWVYDSSLLVYHPYVEDHKKAFSYSFSQGQFISNNFVYDGCINYPVLMTLARPTFGAVRALFFLDLRSFRFYVMRLFHILRGIIHTN